MMVNRRYFFTGSAVAVAVAAVTTGATAATRGRYRIRLTEAEWRKRLSPAQFRTLRLDATDTPFKSPLLNEHRAGTFSCAGCALPVFSSTAKYDSGTGWPSFFQPLPDATRTESDMTLGFERAEVHCRRCGGHLGHVFDDGPAPTGKRYCMNGTALHFTPGKG